MVSHPVLSPTRAFTVFLISLVLLAHPTGARAGCGCDKPPPAPAAVIPSFAFPGMPVTLSSPSFQVGQTWNVVFQSGTTTATVQAVVVSKRTLTDPSGLTMQLQLVVPVPSLPVGPTQILASTSTASLLVPKEAFTVLAKPVVAAEQDTKATVKNYATGVGADGTFYLSVGGLNAVCKAMEFKAYVDKYSLRFETGDIVIYNTQGFLIDTLDENSLAHFFLDPGDKDKSDRLNYFRHSFAQYCQDHQPGGVKEVDPQDSNWHRDGTPHVDYSTLIFAIAGHLQDGSLPAPGSVSSEVHLETKIVADTYEPKDEGVKGAKSK
jgi:hypothetical protein